MSDVNPYIYQILISALDHKGEGEKEFSVVFSTELYVILPIVFWLKLFWPDTNIKACNFRSSYHKKCYWRNFDVADGNQSFTPPTAPLAKTYVKEASKPGKLT